MLFPYNDSQKTKGAYHFSVGTPDRKEKKWGRPWCSNRPINVSLRDGTKIFKVV